VTDLEELKAEACCHWTKLYWLAQCGDIDGIRLEGWGPDFCAFCREFLRFTPTGERVCHGCPVKEHTGQHRCWDTPYDEADKVLSYLACEEPAGPTDLTPVWREVVFLHELPLPKKGG